MECELLLIAQHGTHQFIGAVVIGTSTMLGTKGVSDFGNFQILRYAHRH